MVDVLQAKSSGAGKASDKSSFARSSLREMVLRVPDEHAWTSRFGTVLDLVSIELYHDI